MTNQASIKYISSLFETPARISEGDHNSIALFRQTYPYFIPARYILAAEKHRKVPFTPPMISEIQPYMGNWIMLCGFLEASTQALPAFDKSSANVPGENLVTSKKSVDIGRASVEENKDAKQLKKAPGFPQDNIDKAKSVAKDIPAFIPPVVETVAAKVAETVKPVAEAAIPPVVPAINTEKVAEAVNPVVENIKAAIPAVNTEKVAEVMKQVIEEVKTVIPPVVPAINTEKLAEAVSPVVENIKAAIPAVNTEKLADVAESVMDEVKAVIPTVVPAINTEKLVEAVSPVVENIKAAIPAVNTEKIAEVTKPVIEEVKTVIPPVVPTINTEKLTEAVNPVVENIKAAIPAVNTEQIAEVTKPVTEEEKAAIPPVVSEVNTVKAAEVAKPVIEEIKAVIPPPVVSQVNTEKIAESVKPIVEEVKAVIPPAVVSEVNMEKVAEVMKPVVAEVNNDVADETKEDAETLPIIVSDIKAETPAHGADGKPLYAGGQSGLPTKMIPVKVTLTGTEIPDEEARPIPDDAPGKEESIPELISPVYVDDYFLQQGMKVPDAMPDEIDEFMDTAVDEDDAEKALMVMMSFSEWLLHFKNTTEQRNEEKQDQKALKTMWQKEKLAAAMEEENEEIPENVFEMAVNSITKEDGLASESLADIYIKQGKYDKAIEMYRKLSLRNPKKNAYFARRIEEVLKEKQS